MASEEKLPEELDKLKIAETSPFVKLIDWHIPLALNPFFEADIGSNVAIENLQSTTIQMTKACRRCRFRRRSESHLDDNHLATYAHIHSCVQSTPGVKKTFFKKRPPNTENQKLLIREPVLRTLHTCFHRPNGFLRKMTPTSVEYESATATQNKFVSESVADFRDLISECHSFKEEEEKIGKHFGRLSLNRRNAKSFTTLRISDSQLRSRSHNPYVREGGGGESQEIRPSSSLTVRNTSSSSCSQQASNGSNVNCDDVTINELASYFDTFVHIPKKMSTMAEMMYI